MAERYRLHEESAGKSMSNPPPGKPSAPVSAVSPATTKSQPSTRERRLLTERVRPRDPGRVTSLDAYRGFIMLLLAAGGFGIAAFAAIDADSPVWKIANHDIWQRAAFHFKHPEWRSNFRPWFLADRAAPAVGAEFLNFGVSFWDLIQPAFMFIVGVAMPFSYQKRLAAGHGPARMFAHACVRALVLVLLGVFLYSLASERTNWVFTNVLAQIGLGYVFAYLLLGRRTWLQLTALVLILAGTWALFRWNPFPVEVEAATAEANQAEGVAYAGRFAPWSKGSNAAHGFDLKFLNLLRTIPDDEQTARGIKHDAENWAPEWARRCFFANSEPFVGNPGGYQTLSFLPSIATILLGILCGQVLLAPWRPGKRLGWLLGVGALCFVLGLAGGEFACPIVKRIWTPSWTLFSGGYVIWMLALFYLLFDLLPLRVLAFPLVVLGMNSIAVYLMGEMLRGWTIAHVLRTHATGILETAFGADALAPNMFGPLIFPIGAVILFWLVAWGMARRRIFLRI